MPNQAAGEDRAFVDAVRARDLIVRHDPSIEVVTSGRIYGRAVGGVADTIRLRCEIPDSPCDDRLELLRSFVARSLWRRRLRRLHADGRLAATWQWAPLLAIPLPTAALIADLPYAGQMLAAIEAASPRLIYRRIRPSALPRQIMLGHLALRMLGSRRLSGAVMETLARSPDALRLGAAVGPQKNPSPVTTRG